MSKGKRLFKPYAQLTRRLEVISSDGVEQCWQQLRAKLSSDTHCLFISTHPLFPQAIPANKFQTLLGQEFDSIVFDAFSGLELNALAAISGTLRGGGTFYLLTPLLAIWANYPDPAYQRFLPYPYTAADVQGHFLQRFIRLLTQWDRYTLPSYYVTDTQQVDVVEAISRLSQPLILLADRGRGKSSALGLAASRLITQGKTVLLTAPAKATVAQVYKHATVAPRFIAPDELVQTLPPADVLLVDEAAALPVPLLLKLAAHYHLSVFASTLHGYEGSGRGFSLRFQAELARQSAFKLMRLSQPMRWAANDPLEAFINQACLLATDSPEISALAALPPTYSQLNRDELVQDEALLQQVFALLVNAHYQTRPSDLRQLLDAPNITLHVLVQQNVLLAVLVLSREGSLEPELSEQIYQGKRRPHGHPIPQSLTFHARLQGIAELSCERIMRIAVLPILQNKGLGQILLKHVIHYANQQLTDYMGVSYAMSSALIRFWENVGFQLARIGHRLDTASGSRSAMHVLPLTAKARALFNSPVH